MLTVLINYLKQHNNNNCLWTLYRSASVSQYTQLMVAEGNIDGLKVLQPT